MRLYYTNQTVDRHKAREIATKIEQATGIVLFNPFYSGDAKEALMLDSTGKSNLTHEEIVGRDLKQIRESDGLLALFTSEYNIGSSMEVALASHSWGMKVYVIAPLDYARNHPWIQYFACQLFENHYEFIKYARENFDSVKDWLQKQEQMKAGF